jgi:hypothetical protein
LLTGVAQNAIPPAQVLSQFVPDSRTDSATEIRNKSLVMQVPKPARTQTGPKLKVDVDHCRPSEAPSGKCRWDNRPQRRK